MGAHIGGDHRLSFLSPWDLSIDASLPLLLRLILSTFLADLDGPIPDQSKQRNSC